jgi:hypothetical protein
VCRVSCAGAYVSGAAGSNECPAGSVRIATEAACRAAATAAGKTAGSSSFPFVETTPTYPRGCYYYTTGTNDAYFNTHAVGAGWPNAQLLCAVATAGAPSKRRRRTDARGACTGARTCRHRACAARPSWAVCIIHGRHRDAHTYISRYIHTYIYPCDADGARRRCRAAHGSAGGRRPGVHGHGHVRVLKGYSKRGTQKGYSKGY